MRFAAIVLLTTGVAQAPPATPVRVGEILVRELQELRPVPGNLRAVSRAEVAGIEPGRVEQVRFEVGTTVAAGDVLAELDVRRLELDLAQARAARDAIVKIVAEREAILEDAREDLAAREQAAAENPGAVSQQDLRQGRTDVRLAEARLAFSHAEKIEADTRCELLEVRIADATVRAPFTGKIVARHIEPGEWLAAGGRVATVVSTGVIEAWIEVDESFDYAVLEELDSLRVHVATIGAEFVADRVRVVGDVDPRSRRYVLIADLAPNGRPLAPGMSVTALVPTGHGIERLLVPSDAILRDSGGAFVYVLRPSPFGGEQAVPAAVHVLYALDATTSVAAIEPELAAGDRVVVEGNERLRPGAPVQVVAGSGGGAEGR